jgi:hypothetical protein
LKRQQKRPNLSIFPIFPDTRCERLLPIDASPGDRGLAVLPARPAMALGNGNDLGRQGNLAEEGGW